MNLPGQNLKKKMTDDPEGKKTYNRLTTWRTDVDAPAANKNGRPMTFR